MKNTRVTSGDIIILGSRSNSFYNQGGLIMKKLLKFWEDVVLV